METDPSTNENLQTPDEMSRELYVELERLDRRREYIINLLGVLAAQNEKLF